MSLSENLAKESISKLSLRELITASPDATVREAVEMMRDKQLGCVVIVDDAGAPIGWFNEMHLTKLLLGDPADMDKPLSAFMDGKIAVAKQTDSIDAAIDQLLVGATRFVVVVDDAGKAVALSGERGVTEYIADHFPRTVLTSEAGAKPYMESREGG